MTHPRTIFHRRTQTAPVAASSRAAGTGRIGGTGRTGGTGRAGGDAETSVWRALYRVAGVSAAITAVAIPLHIVAFVLRPPPYGGTAQAWFALFRDNWLIGLLSLDLLLMVDYVLLIPIFLALYVALRRTSGSVMAIGTSFGLVGIAIYFSSNTAFEMLSLSGRYTAAATDAERSALLAAGEAMMATYQGTAFQVAYVLGSVAGILIGIGMLRSGVFGRAVAYLAILGNAIGLGLYVPEIGISLSVGSGVVLWAWYILLARKFFQIGNR